VRKNSPKLLEAANEWLREEKKSLEYRLVYNKYFKNQKASSRRFASDYYSLRSGKISAFDDILKEYASKADMDWRLLAALVYQESRFDPNAQSWMGAQGLMQVLPSTAQRFGIRNLRHPESNVKAGTAYLQFLNRFWAKEIPDSAQRIRFVLASYNAGLGHVADARRLADKYGRNPDRWKNNVDTFLLLKSDRQYYLDPVVRYGYCRGSEPYHYVRDILERYESYQQFFRDTTAPGADSIQVFHRPRATEQPFAFARRSYQAPSKPHSIWTTSLYCTATLPPTRRHTAFTCPT
jgi:membrane-bound lytic murein transglycosylase F